MSFPKRQPFENTAGYSALVVPSNSTAFTEIPQRLRVNNTGVVYVDMAGNGELGATATGTVTVNLGGAGTVTATIGGTAVSVTWDTSDAITGPILATAINANSTVNKLVTAVAVGAIVTLTPTVAGKGGNGITVVGTLGCAASGATLTGGTGGDGNYIPRTAADKETLNIAVSRVYITGTTATNIYAEW